MRSLTTPLIRALDLRLPPPPNPLDPDNWAWDWPTVPECAGRRDSVTFPPMALMTGDSFKITSVIGPFGWTVLAS